mgnify:FL=1
MRQKKIVMSCEGLKGQALKDCKSGIKFTLFKQANNNTNRLNMVNSSTPATQRDSIQYRTGFERGQKGWKPSTMRLKYQGETEYEKMGRWEGQNTPKKKGS